MFLREDEHLVVEKAPVAGVLADGDDGNQEARSSGEVRSLSYSIVMVSLRWIGEWSDDGTAYLSGLLLQHQQLVDGTLNIGLDPEKSVHLMEVVVYWVIRTFARASASGMSLSASLVKSFSGFSRPADMMTNVDEEFRRSIHEGRETEQRSGLSNCTASYQHDDER
jgi:hypothetical protein